MMTMIQHPGDSTQNKRMIVYLNPLRIQAALENERKRLQCGQSRTSIVLGIRTRTRTRTHCPPKNRQRNPSSTPTTAALPNPHTTRTGARRRRRRGNRLNKPKPKPANPHKIMIPPRELPRQCRRIIPRRKQMHHEPPRGENRGERLRRPFHVERHHGLRV